MRGTRWLLLIAILAILGGVGATYRFQKRFLQEQAPKKPHALPVELNSAAEDWTFTQTAGDRAVVHIRARNFKQVKDSGVTELEGVELRIFQKDGNSYDRIQSAHAEFSAANHRLYSDGTVAITLHVPVEGQPKHTLVSIQSSGVTFDSSNGKAWTDRPATFTFENGSGKAVGASYDPIAR